MGKYRALSEALGLVRGDRIRLSFEEIESVLLFLLPASARKYRAWWSNDLSHVQASEGWLSAGWRATDVDIAGGSAAFERDAGTVKGSKEARTSRRTRSVVSYRDFELLAGESMSQRYGKRLRPGNVPPVPKLFDCVSDDRQIVGDAKYFTMVRGMAIPPAKFSVVAEHVWLLSQLKAEHKFLVFGNDKRVPLEWLRRYGHMAANVEFYFLDVAASRIERLHNLPKGRGEGNVSS